MLVATDRALYRCAFSYRDGTLGEARRAVALSRRLEERGYLVGAIRPPTVPLGTSRLRVTFSAAHRDEDVEALAAAMRDVLREESP